jgi:hypothetical protein
MRLSLSSHGPSSQGSRFEHRRDGLPCGDTGRSVSTTPPQGRVTTEVVVELGETNPGVRSSGRERTRGRSWSRVPRRDSSRLAYGSPRAGRWFLGRATRPAPETSSCRTSSLGRTTPYRWWWPSDDPRREMVALRSPRSSASSSQSLQPAHPCASGRPLSSRPDGCGKRHLVRRLPADTSVRWDLSRRGRRCQPPRSAPTSRAGEPGRNSPRRRFLRRSRRVAAIRPLRWRQIVSMRVDPRERGPRRR